jgi:tellurium resistance protein TerD
VVGLGWDVKAQFEMGADYDLDVAVFMVDARGKMASPRDLVYYSNPRSKCGGVFHTGDNLTGEGEGDDEQLIFDLDRIPPLYDKLIVAVQIYDAQARGQNFGAVESCYVRLFVPKSFSMSSGKKLEVGKPLLNYDLREEYSQATAIVFCEIYRYQGAWKFRAVGKPFMGSFQELMNLLRP